MADLFTPEVTPAEYDPTWMQQQLERIASALQELEPPYIILSIQNVEPSRKKEGMVVNADGTNWNPGSGAGLYEYVGGSWSKL